MKNELTIFADHQIRRAYDAEKERWFFSIIDIIRALLQQPNYQTARKYWNKLKERLKKEGSEVVTSCHRLKLTASDGKKYLTDVADAETLLRLIQTVPSPQAEPIKLWLAKVGHERMQEMVDPEKSLERAKANWRKHGRSDKWIQQRMVGRETRQKLTDYWKEHGIKEGKEFSILTNIIHQEWSDLSIKEHKELKGLTAQNLRDHMTDAELIFTALAELSTRQFAESMEATGMEENEEAGKQGGSIAKKARLELEKKTGKKVVSSANYLLPQEKSATKSKSVEKIGSSQKSVEKVESSDKSANSLPIQEDSSAKPFTKPSLKGVEKAISSKKAENHVSIQADVSAKAVKTTKPSQKSVGKAKSAKAIQKTKSIKK